VGAKKRLPPHTAVRWTQYVNCETRRTFEAEAGRAALRVADETGGRAGGEAYRRHLAIVLNPDGDRRHALLLYPAGPAGEARPVLGAKLRGRDKGRIAYGQPRSMEIVPGRPFLDLAWRENRDMQGAAERGDRFKQGKGLYRKRSQLLAEARLLSLGVFAALGLVSPPPPPPPPPTPVEPGSRQRRSLERQPEAVYEPPPALAQPRLLGDGLELTALFAWDLCRQHADVRLAITSYAIVQGLYENKYAVGYHEDTNKFGETWATVRPERDGNEPVAPTRVPQLGVNLCTETNRTVWTGYLGSLLHATGACDGAVAKAVAGPRPEGWRPSRSAHETFVIQAGGSTGSRARKPSWRLWIFPNKSCRVTTM